MKLYYLDPNNWGAHWTVCAETPEEALEYCIEKMRVEMERDKEDDKRLHGDDEDFDPTFYDDGTYYHMFKDVTVDNLPKKFKLKEYPIGKVIRGENA